MKLLAVAALLVISLPRPLVVLRLERRTTEPAVADPLRAVYTGTVGLLAIIVFIAQVLAH